MATYDLNIGEHKLTISSEDLQDIVVDFGTGELTIWQGTDRYLVIKEGGGHWEVSSLSGVSNHPGGFETQGGFLLVHQVAT